MCPSGGHAPKVVLFAPAMNGVLSTTRSSVALAIWGNAGEMSCAPVSGDGRVRTTDALMIMVKAPVVEDIKKIMMKKNRLVKESRERVVHNKDVQRKEGIHKY